MFVVLELVKYAELDVCGSDYPLPLCFAYGMAGVLPVFETKELAEAYAGGHSKILPIKVGAD